MSLLLSSQHIADLTSLENDNDVIYEQEAALPVRDVTLGDILFPDRAAVSSHSEDTSSSTRSKKLSPSRSSDISLQRKIQEMLMSARQNRIPRKRSTHSDVSDEEILIERRNRKLLQQYWQHVDGGTARGDKTNRWKK